MFTGIIETTGRVEAIERSGSNRIYTIASDIAGELKIDQSVCHDGVCLTVVETGQQTHKVTAIEETLLKSNLNNWNVGTLINLERAMMPSARLDGHIVQGHVDITAACHDIEERSGSWYFTFRYLPTAEHLLVNKGSVCINGVSLTVVDPVDDLFQVAIIPYTFEHTNFKSLAKGDLVNIEFDVIGKYVARHLAFFRKGVGV